MITEDIKKYIGQSVLCWLATVSKEGIPNVSPKEIFTWLDEEHLIIANIASPKSIKNIKSNPNVCISFIDILVQKGYKLVGKAKIIKKSDVLFEKEVKKLKLMAGEAFPISALIKIKITKIAPILAPSYLLYPNETKEADQIKSALKAYKIK